MTIRVFSRWKFLAAIGLSIVSVPSIYAANVSLRGTLIEPPPCRINDGNKIEVNFTDRVGIKKIDGINYRTTMSYQITCEPGTTNSNWLLSLTLKGDLALFDTEKSAIQTDVAGLGIKVYQEGSAFELDKPINITLLSPPLLEAVPIKNPTIELTEGPFNATATLQAEYQ